MQRHKTTNLRRAAESNAPPSPGGAGPSRTTQPPPTAASRSEGARPVHQRLGLNPGADLRQRIEESRSRSVRTASTQAEIQRLANENEALCEQIRWLGQQPTTMQHQDGRSFALTTPARCEKSQEAQSASRHVHSRLERGRQPLRAPNG